MKYRILIVLTILLILPSKVSLPSGLQISGGADTRLVNTGGKENDIELEGLFLNLRKVFSDEKGDRLIAVGQIDFDNNFNDIRPYQTYLQYKGPLGKWNIRAGHYILPFGLLSSYDTERLVLKTVEDLNLGIKLDTGIELLGFFGDFDYAISLSQGVGRNRLTDIDNNKLVAARLGWQGNDISLGLSGLVGNVLTEENSVIRKDIGLNNIYEKRVGLDITKYIGPLVLRGEVNIGEDDNEAVGGGVILADYAITPKLELNLKYARWQRKGGRNFAGVGISYELYKGLFLKIANEYQFGKEDKNVATLQVYFEFSRQF